MIGLLHAEHVQCQFIGYIIRRTYFSQIIYCFFSQIQRNSQSNVNLMLPYITNFFHGLNVFIIESLCQDQGLIRRIPPWFPLRHTKISDSAAHEIQVTQPPIITQHCADVAKTGQKLRQSVLVRLYPNS